jgi:hypothetical protein
MATLVDIARSHSTGAEISLEGTANNENDYNNNVTVKGITKLTWTELQAEMEKVAYIAKREGEYPSFADQFDKIFHDGIDEWKKVIQAVKTKYPKPE